MSESDTIFALSSGPPPAGIAVIRISGPGVRFGLETLIESVPEPREAVVRTMKAADGSAIDRGVVLFFPGPRSFTGEDVAELQVHGGRAVVAASLAALAALPYQIEYTAEVYRERLGNALLQNLLPDPGLIEQDNLTLGRALHREMDKALALSHGLLSHSGTAMAEAFRREGVFRLRSLTELLPRPK